MATIISPIIPTTGVNIASSIDPTNSATVITIRSVGDISAGSGSADTSAEDLVFGAGLSGGQSEKVKKAPKNPTNIGEQRNKQPTQKTEDTYLERIQSANPAYRLSKNAKSISKFHVKKYGKIPKTKKR